MPSDNKISMPGAFGGLMRYDEEYENKFIFTPMQIMGFLIGIVLFVILLKLFWPVSIVASG